MKLIVLDIDGVLSAEACPLDLARLARLADINRRARQDESVPAITLNTGRPSPYVEAIMQAIDGWQPALYESGAGMYLPQSYRFQTSPHFSESHRAELREIVRRLDTALVQTDRAYWQPGKSFCYTLYVPPPRAAADFLDEAQNIIEQVSDQFVAKTAVRALNIHSKLVDKGTGLQWLAEVTGINPTQMGGVGDSAADIDFLKLIGYPAAPVNATDGVKKVAKYISPLPDIVGLHDIFDRWGIF